MLIRTFNTAVKKELGNKLLTKKGNSVVNTKMFTRLRSTRHKIKVTNSSKLCSDSYFKN